MPHSARKMSESGYYHVVAKAIADQMIFESDVDRRYYIKLLDTATTETYCTLHAYCLMSNHVHLVIEDNFDSLATLMKYVDERYGMYFANKTERNGGIFRKPFWSESINTDAYLLCAVRYVHANPTVAGICSPFFYEWSSAKDYMGRNGITDTSKILAMCGNTDSFVRFSNQMPACAQAFPGSKLIGHINDEEALRVARLTLGADELRSIGSLPISDRNDAIRKLKQTGLTLRQIARATGLGYYTVRVA